MMSENIKELSIARDKLLNDSSMTPEQLSMKCEAMLAQYSRHCNATVLFMAGGIRSADLVSPFKATA